ncbi:MAG: M56 family metallopeptidase [Oscillospiraceae bacterium]|nr:M56 family metallopeptidase [Candidatus Ruminococcus equi]
MRVTTNFYEIFTLFSFYSFLMAVITSSIMIVIAYFLRKNKYFARTFGAWFVVALYVLSIARMFLPIEIKGHILIEDKIVLAKIMNVLENRSELTSSLPLYVTTILLIVWLFVSIVLIVIFAVKQKKFMNKISGLKDYSTKEERAVLEKVKKSVFKKERNIELIKTDAVSVAMVVGVRKNIILLPNYDYSEKELYYILLHECTHLKNNDLRIKLLVHIYCCLFFWNPFAYLLKKDLDTTLELKCDMCVAGYLGEEEQADYCEAILDSLKRLKEKEQKTPYVVASGFIKIKKKNLTKDRIENLLLTPPNRRKQRVVNFLVLVLFAAVFASSYLVIWQPVYNLSEEQYAEEEPDAVISDETNSYLVEQEDGSYIFYFEGYEIPVPKEDFDAGYYNCYPVKNKKE